MLPLTAQAAAHCRAPETSAGVVAAATTVLVAAALLLLLLEEVGMLRAVEEPSERSTRHLSARRGKPGTSTAAKLPC